MLEESFKSLYRRLWHYAGRLGVAKHERDDLIQEVFVRVYGRREGYSEIGDPVGYLFTALRHAWISKQRSRTAVRRGGDSLEELDVTAEDPPSNVRSPEEEALAKEQEARLRDAMAALPVRMRRCAVLRFSRDLSYEEIADRLGITIGAVKAHLHKARQRVAEILGDGETT